MNNSRKIENKLIQLGILSKYGRSSIREIEEIEEEFGLNLPIEYKDFLQNFGTLNFNDIEIAFYPEHNWNEEFLTIVNFYGVGSGNFDLKVIINRYNGRIPEGLIPIAECPGGDQLCIGTINETFGKLYYWDHNKEKMQVTSIDDMWVPVTLIYSSFFEMIMSSQEIEENNNFNDSSIESIQISEKFLSRIKNRR